VLGSGLSPILSAEVMLRQRSELRFRPGSFASSKKPKHTVNLVQQSLTTVNLVQSQSTSFNHSQPRSITVNLVQQIKLVQSQST